MNRVAKASILGALVLWIASTPLWADDQLSPAIIAKCEGLTLGEIIPPNPQYQTITGGKRQANRGILEYLLGMGAEGYYPSPVGAIAAMPSYMSSLPPGSLWIDAGAGRGLGTAQYQLIANGHLPRTMWFPENIQFNPSLRVRAYSMDRFDLSNTDTATAIRLGLVDYRIEDLVQVASMPENQGLASVLTAFYGVEYYVHFNHALPTFAALLKPGGRADFHALEEYVPLFFLRLYMQQVRGLRWVESRFTDGTSLRGREYPVMGSFGYFERTAEPLYFPRVQRNGYWVTNWEIEGVSAAEISTAAERAGWEFDPRHRREAAGLLVSPN